MTFSRRQVLLASVAWLGSSRAALAAARASLLQLRVEYTAASVIGVDERTTTGRLWRTPAALRHEGTETGRPLTVIARLDRNVAWLVMAEPRFVIETDLATLDLPLDTLNGGGGMRQTREARERVNGLDTLRVRVERKVASGGGFSGRVWVTSQGVIARLAGEGESHGRRGRALMNFRDVQIGPLDPDLFEAPRGVNLVRVAGGGLVGLLQGMEAAGRIARRR